MIRFKFYQNEILKYLNKDSSILILGASDQEGHLFQKLRYKNLPYLMLI